MKNDSMKRLAIGVVLFLIGVVFAVISWMILPDAVSTQFAGFQTGVPAFPKLLAVFIAFGFSTMFSVFSVKHDEAIKFTLIGYGLHILYWVCNL